jgi:hypothetical protein
MAVQVSTYLNYARVTQYLAADGNPKRLLFQGSDNRAQQANLLFMTRKVINWLNSLDSTDGRLPNMANYMYSLCNPYVAEARRIINAGSTGNIVNPSTGNNVTIATPLVQFRVGDVGAPMIAGETTLTLIYAGVVNPSVEITLDGTELPYGDITQISYTVTYNPANIEIVFNQGVQTDQLYMIHMVQLVNV